MLMLIVVCRRYLEQNEATQAIHISMNILNTQFLLKKKEIPKLNANNNLFL